MSLSYETAFRLVEQGEFGELRRLADPHLANAMPFEPRVLVMVAHALVYTGESRRALSLLSTLDLESKTTRLNRSRARVVLGLANRSAGSMTKALSEFQKALHIAQESGTPEEAAWAYLYLFRHTIDGHPADLAPAMLPAVRAAVTKAASPGASAFLHMCVAVLEGQNGRLNEATRHSEIAQSLISLARNAWLHCGNQLNRAAILLAGCRFADAMKVLEALREEAERHGLRYERDKAEANLGHLHAMVGHHRQALETLSNIASSPGASRLSSLSACEGMARAYLWQGDLPRCQDMLDRIDAAADEDDALANAYAVRWAAITRARLYVQMGQLTAALELLGRVENRYRGTPDGPFSAALSMIAAQALAIGGRTNEAAFQLIQADRLGVTSIRELQGQFYSAAASTLVSGEAELASGLRRRAADVWVEQGTAWMGTRTDVSTPSGHSSTQVNNGTHWAVNALASAIDLAYNPRLLFRQLASTIESLGCSPKVQALVVSGETAVEAREGVEILRLGLVDDNVWHLESELPSEPSRALVLTDVLRVARAAVALERLKAEEHNRTALWPAETGNQTENTLFLSDEMREVADTARRVASTDVPVLITGETGTGKEIIARFIHSRSARVKRGFVPFNCATVPKEMMDSQLFGHRRGAFTGATDSFQGVIRSAQGGTLLLDEIGDLSLECQPKLLRFLESGEILPLGESTPVYVDVRVIAATNADLDAAVSAGRFREDLYYRLNIVQLKVPPLRERRTEIPSLSRHYLRKFARECDKGDLRLGEATVECLVLSDWPGNIRQVVNEMRRLAALAETGAVLMPEHLSPEIRHSRRTIPAAVVANEPNQVVVRLDQPMAAAVRHIEGAMLRFAMARYEGRVDAVAKALGLSRKGLYLKRQRYRDDVALP